jgi:hypothetical protein
MKRAILYTAMLRGAPKYSRASGKARQEATVADIGTDLDA